MGTQNDYAKKARKKNLLLKDNQHSSERFLSYADAMSLVRQSRNRGNYSQGQYYLQQIFQQVKNIPEPGLYLMNVYLEALDIEQASSLVDFLLKKFPRDVDVLRHCARFYQFTDNIEKALDLVDDCIKLRPDNADNYEVKGLIFRSIGDRKSALRAFDRSLKRDPDKASVLLEKAKLLKADANASDIAGVEKLLATKQVQSRDLGTLHFALAWMYEPADTAKHFAHLNAANAVFSSLRPYSAEASKGLLEQTISRFSRRWVNATAGLGDESKEPIFIAALPRSGTTLPRAEFIFRYRVSKEKSLKQSRSNKRNSSYAST